MKPNIEPYKAGMLATLPLQMVSVKAGFPSPAEDFIDINLNLNDYLIKHPAATFFLRMEGGAMEGAGIFAGDLLIVDRSLDPYDNAIIVTALDGELTVKIYKKEKRNVVLTTTGKHGESTIVNQDMQFEVWGVVTTVIHSVQKS